MGSEAVRGARSVGRERVIAMKWCWIMLMLSTAAHAGATEDSLSVGPFGVVRLYYECPNPANVVLFVSGDGGWNLGVVDMARALASLDAVVAGVDIDRYLRALGRSREACLYPAGDFENLSKAVQQRLGAPAYTTPVLVGYSSGATLVYAVLVESPANTFKGAISLGFCPDLPLDRPLCRGEGLGWTPGPGGKGCSFLPASTLEVPWVALQGEIDRVCGAEETRAFVSRVPNGRIVMLPKVGHGFSVQRNWMPQFKAAFARIVSDTAAPPLGGPARTERTRCSGSSAASAPSAASEAPARGAGETARDDLRDLPLVEVAATIRAGDAFAVVLSGDGGWGTTERGLSRELAAKGIDVVGWNSLRYYWKKRTPDEAAADLARILRRYGRSWRATRVVLVGYSFGADVLPFLVTRLPADLRAEVTSIVLIGLSSYAEFSFHLGDWLGRAPATKEYPTLPELEKLRGMKITAFHGEHDSDAQCLGKDTGLATCVTLPGGHRIGGDYSPISRAILEQVRK
jgi:type IV secretory pathway VirJ component